MAEASRREAAIQKRAKLEQYAAAFASARRDAATIETSLHAPALRSPVRNVRLRTIFNQATSQRSVYNAAAAAVHDNEETFHDLAT